MFLVLEISSMIKDLQMTSRKAEKSIMNSYSVFKQSLPSMIWLRRLISNSILKESFNQELEISSYGKPARLVTLGRSRGAAFRQNKGHREHLESLSLTRYLKSTNDQQCMQIKSPTPNKTQIAIYQRSLSKKNK